MRWLTFNSCPAKTGIVYIEIFLDFDIVALLFLFNKYCPIMK